MEDYFLSTCSLFRGHIDLSGVFPNAMILVAEKKSHIRSPRCRMFHVFYHTTSTKAQVVFFCFQPFFMAVDQAQSHWRQTNMMIHKYPGFGCGVLYGYLDLAWKLCLKHVLRRYLDLKNTPKTPNLRRYGWMSRFKQKWTKKTKCIWLKLVRNHWSKCRICDKKLATRVTHLFWQLLPLEPLNFNPTNRHPRKTSPSL